MSSFLLRLDMITREGKSMKAFIFMIKYFKCSDLKITKSVNNCYFLD